MNLVQSILANQTSLYCYLNTVLYVMPSLILFHTFFGNNFKKGVRSVGQLWPEPYLFNIFGVLNYECFGLNGLVLAQFTDMPRSVAQGLVLAQFWGLAQVRGLKPSVSTV